MAKYSYEFKLKVVQEYLNGEGGYNYLCKKYNISTKIRLQEWVALYKKFGNDGLMRSRKNNNYSFQFKLHMVELYLSSEVSYQELALSQGIFTPALLAKWVNDFRNAGPDALRPKKKGRKKTLGTKNNSTPNIENKPIDTSAEHIKELEDELLKIKNRKCIFKRIEETAFGGGSSSEKTARIIHSLRGEFKLNDILAVVGFPKVNIYVLAKAI